MALAVVLMCSFALPTYAADGTDDFLASEMDYEAQGYRGTSDGVVVEDITSTVTTNTSGDYFYWYFPASISVDYPIKLLIASQPFSINDGHEYNLNFSYYQNRKADLYLQVDLIYFDNEGVELKRVTLFNNNGISDTAPHEVNIDFKPDSSDISTGYKCKLVFTYQTHAETLTSPIVFYISKNVNLNDKDDDSGWFQKIINKIEETISNIKEIPSKINQKLTELKESITNAFVELKENLIEGLKGLFVPSDGFFEEKKAELELFLEDHFGILWTAPNIMISTIKQLLTMSPEEPSITMPAIQFTWEDELITLTEPMTVHFNDYIGEGTPLETFYNFYRIFVTIILIFLFINYCLKKYHYIFGKDGEAVEH